MTPASSCSATLRFVAALTLIVYGTQVNAQATATVMGRVTDEFSMPLASVTVNATGTTIGAITRDDGRFRIMLAPGTYEIRLRRIGYSQRVDTVRVADGETITRDYQLEQARTALQAIAVIGSRGEARTVINSPVPVDVLTQEDIRATGRIETAQIIQQLAPSFNFPRPSVNDGTDHVRPASLRGLSPDQVLVLVNGKRRHTGALVNVNASIGRGSSPVDLNAIPASMIERIEVLRDGAAAQYGSDAIAGVINIVLKSTAPGEVTAMVGQSCSSLEGAPGPSDTCNRKDGDVRMAGIDAGFSRGEGTYFHAGGEYRDRRATNRSLGDPRPQSFTEVDAATFRTNATGPINHRVGDAGTTDFVAMFNAGTDISMMGGAQLYGFGGAGKREGEAAGFFRRSQDDRTVRSIHPNGFLPLIESDILDASLGAGLKGTRSGWRYDLSSVYGRNEFEFRVTNSNNVSLGNASPRTFDAGTLRFDQLSTNLDVFHEFQFLEGRPLRFGAGAEYRRDGYGIDNGELASYVNGGQKVLDPSGNPTTRSGAVGSQVFPGFKPDDAKDESRSATSLYADFESDISPILLLNLAGRFENFSDFGSTSNGKVAARFNPFPALVFRGAFGTGFRAPSLNQIYFSSTATNFIGGVPKDILTLPVESDAARALGAASLKPEKSINYSVGIASEPIPSFGISVDYYYIIIEDRIVLSENFVGPNVANLFPGREVGGARFFTNAIDTRTFGFDVVANYGINLQGRGTVRLTGGYAQNETYVDRVSKTPPELVGQDEVLFGRVERARIEEGQPKNNILASANYQWQKLGLTLRAQRFGEVTVRTPRLNIAPANQQADQTFSAKWISDVSASFDLIQRLRLTVGADNVFDVYPDRNSQNGDARKGFSGNSFFGIFAYNGASPFGFNGRFIYARTSYRF